MKKAIIRPLLLLLCVCSMSFAQDAPLVETAPDSAAQKATAPVAAADSETSSGVTAAPLAADETTDTPDWPTVIDFKMLRNAKWAYKKDPEFSEEIMALDGKQVTMRGFMFPYDDYKNVRRFMLIEMADGCFYCESPTPMDMVYVSKTQKEDNEYITVPIEVTGTFKLWKKESEEKAHKSFVYFIDDATMTVVEE